MAVWEIERAVEGPAVPRLDARDRPGGEERDEVVGIERLADGELELDHPAHDGGGVARFCVELCPLSGHKSSSEPAQSQAGTSTGEGAGAGSVAGATRVRSSQRPATQITTAAANAGPLAGQLGDDAEQRGRPRRCRSRRTS